ncbi:MAG TPA: hypothetical protein VF157_01420 [Chloroflexota bacterium]
MLLDFAAGTAAERAAARGVLEATLAEDALAVCPVVVAEIGPQFGTGGELDGFLADLGIRVDAFATSTLWEAGQKWSLYARRRGRQAHRTTCGSGMTIRCPSCGAVMNWRQHILSDFLIGAHAQLQGDGLITREVGFYRTYFPELKLIVPAAQ